MKSKGTLGLALVTVLIVGYAYFFEYKKRIVEKAEKERDELILKVQTDDIARFTLVSKDKVVIENQDGAWKVVSPVVDDADGTQIKNFLDIITKEKAEIEIDDDLQDAKVYGLDKPLAILEIVSRDGKVKKVSVGAEAIQGKNYIQVDENKSVFVSSSQWKILTERTLKDFRSKNIYRGGDIHTLEVESPGQPKIVLKLIDGKWTMEGAKFPLDAPAIKAFVGQVENLHATDIVSETQEGLAKYGLDRPAVTLRMVGKDNKDPVVVRISPPQNGNRDSFIVASTLKPVFKSFAALSQSYIKKPSNFRDREEPFQYTLAEVIGVRTKAPQFDYRFIKKGEAWYLEKPESDRDVDQSQLMSLLTGIQGTRVSEYLGKVPFTPWRTIDLLDKDGNSVLKVELGDEIKGKNRRLAKTSRVDEVFSVDATMIDTLPGQNLVKEKAKPQ